LTVAKQKKKKAGRPITRRPRWEVFATSESGDDYGVLETFTSRPTTADLKRITSYDVMGSDTVAGRGPWVLVYRDGRERARFRASAVASAEALNDGPPMAVRVHESLVQLHPKPYVVVYMIGGSSVVLVGVEYGALVAVLDGAEPVTINFNSPVTRDRP